jgi:hypothetical protein
MPVTRIRRIIAEKNKKEISANPLYPRHPRSISPYTGMKNAPRPVKIIPDDFAKNLSNAIDFKRRIAGAN